jgi:hypothetical protein
MRRRLDCTKTSAALTGRLPASASLTTPEDSLPWQLGNRLGRLQRNDDENEQNPVQ